jgi:serine/threonine-protein kinase
MEKALLRAVLDHSGDETARLVFADWLEERGDRRAPFFRTLPSSEPRYELQRERWRDGPYPCYEAFDRVRQRPVVLSVSGGGWRSQAPVWRGAAVAALSHPNLIPLEDLGCSAEGYLYVAQPPVDGHSLEDLLGRPGVAAAGEPSPPALPQVVGALRGACAGVAYVHAQGIPHGHLTPRSLLVASRSGQVFVTDWEAAWDADEPDTDPASVVSVLGDPGYLAPERVSGEAPGLAPAVDVYALGGILYRALYGHSPHGSPADGMSALLRRALEPKRPGKHRPGLFPGGRAAQREEQVALAALEGVCLKALANDPGQRHAGAAELGAALGEWLETHGPLWSQPGPFAQLRSWLGW